MNTDDFATAALEEADARAYGNRAGVFCNAFVSGAVWARAHLAAQEPTDAEHRIARLEAQTDIRGRAVAIYQRRAREAEAERDWNWRSSRQSKIERIKANTRADRAEAEARAQRRRADDMEDNALRAQTNLRAAEERADEWRHRIRQLTYNAKRRNETIRPDQILAILEQRKA